MSGHGPQFDDFAAPPSAPHGGTTFDEGFTRNPGSTAEHGGLEYDENFRRMAAVTKHGERWDEFDWKALPPHHGQNFDEDFAMPAALKDGEHGTWMDVFRGGTQVRYLDRGHNVEGIAIRCTPTHLVVQQRYTENQGGKRKDLSEVALGQIVEWRYADQASGGKRRPKAVPGSTPADVPDRLDSPSLGARGGGRTDGPSVSDSKTMGKTHDEDEDELVEKAFAELPPDALDDVEAIAKGNKGNTGRGSTTPGSSAARSRATKAPRHPGGQIDHAAARQILAQRSAAFRAGVASSREKTLPRIHHGGFKCTGCSHTSWRQHPVAAAGGGVHKQIAMRGCASCGLLHPHRVGKTEQVDVDVVKTVDTTETALLGPPSDDGTVGKVGHRTGCPRGGSDPCGADEAGKCSACGAEVRDHQAVGKQLDPLLEVRKIARVLG